MKTLRMLSQVAMGMSLLFGFTAQAGVAAVAVWCDGFPDCVGNGTPAFINSLDGLTAMVVTSAQLGTPGFLDDFQAIFVTRVDQQFGGGMPLAAATQVRNYVRPDDPDAGNVVLFAGDWCDNLPTSSVGNPPDSNVSQFIENAVRYAAASGHGYVGEFNGAVMGATTNEPGIQTLALLPGDASAVRMFDPSLNVITLTGYGDPFLTDMIPDSFDGVDVTTWRTTVTRVPDENVVATFDDGVPAVIATAVK